MYLKNTLFDYSSRQIHYLTWCCISNTLFQIHDLTTVRGDKCGRKRKAAPRCRISLSPAFIFGEFCSKFLILFSIPTTQVAEYYSQVHAALHFPNLPCLTAIAADAETVLFFPLEVCSLEYSPLAPPLTQLGVERGLGGEGGGGGGLDTGGWDMEDS